MSEAVVYLALGLLVLGASWLPLFLRGTPVSLPMLVMGLGILLAVPFEAEHPLLDHTWWVEHVTAIALLVSVMGAGLRLDRPFSLMGWGGVWRLLGIVMPLSILAIASLGTALLSLPFAYALLVGGILAPTDPVLAEEVKVGPPGSEDESDARFNLTAEAGLNDGLAFPFVLLALSMATDPGYRAADLGSWFVRDLVWGVAAGAASGAAFGSALVWLNLRLREELRLSATRSGFVALALSFLAYGLVEAVGGNGYVGVFVLALTIRRAVREVEYPRQLDHFLSEMEQIVMVVVVALFGLSIGNGLLRDVGPWEVVATGIVLLVIRPAATWIGLLRSGLHQRSRAAIGYFGIRGLGALFYLTYALEQRHDQIPSSAVALVALVVGASIVLYGMSTARVVRKLRLRG